MDETEALLDRFSNPERKRKRKEEKEQKQLQRAAKNITEKQSLELVFNDPLTPQECNLLKPFLTNKLATREQLAKWIDTTTQDSIGFVSSADNSMVNFFNCSFHCEEWFQAKLLEIGFTHNKTNYNFIPLCHTVTELLAENVVGFKMACKQMMRYLEKTSV
jgi:hypothetical protein